ELDEARVVLRGFARDALRGNSQSAEIQHLERFANLFFGPAFAAQSSFFVGEQIAERRFCATCRVSHTGFEQNRFVTIDRFTLEDLADRAAGDSFRGEQITGSKKNSDSNTFLG